MTLWLLLVLLLAMISTDALDSGCPVGLLGTNVLVDSALTVTQVTGAELPQLPGKFTHNMPLL